MVSPPSAEKNSGMPFFPTPSTQRQCFQDEDELPRYDDFQQHTQPGEEQQPHDRLRNLKYKALNSQREWHRMGVVLSWYGIGLFINAHVVLDRLPQGDEWKAGLKHRFLLVFTPLHVLFAISFFWHISSLIIVNRLRRTLHNVGNLAIGMAFVVAASLSISAGNIFFVQNACDSNLPKMKDYILCLTRGGMGSTMFWTLVAGMAVAFLAGILHLCILLMALRGRNQWQLQMADGFEVQNWTKEAQEVFGTASTSRKVSTRHTVCSQHFKLLGEKYTPNITQEKKIDVSQSSTRPAGRVLVKHLSGFKKSADLETVGESWADEALHTLVGSAKAAGKKPSRRLLMTDADLEEGWTRL